MMKKNILFIGGKGKGKSSLIRQILHQKVQNVDYHLIVVQTLYMMSDKELNNLIPQYKIMIVDEGYSTIHLHFMQKLTKMFPDTMFLCCFNDSYEPVLLDKLEESFYIFQCNYELNPNQVNDLVSLVPWLSSFMHATSIDKVFSPAEPLEANPNFVPFNHYVAKNNPEWVVCRNGETPTEFQIVEFKYVKVRYPVFYTVGDQCRSVTIRGEHIAGRTHAYDLMLFPQINPGTL